MSIKTSITRWIIGTTLAAAALWSGTASAASAVPATLTQQGRILDKDGEPVSSKVHFVFTVYDVAEGGEAKNALWTEEQDITLDDGYFSTELGSVAAIPPTLFDGSVRYLGVTVGNDDEMVPRQTISSVPYALMAATAASVPFTSISGVPAACADGSYLKGFDEKGAAACGTLPALSCRTVFGTAATNATVAFVGCAAGEVPTGGGCETNGALKSSYPYTCTSKLPTGCNVIILCQNPPCVSYGDWYCSTTAAATIQPYIRCCSVK